MLDSGCEVHVADGTDFPGYAVHATDDSRAGRGFNVADGKSTPNKGGAVPQFCTGRGERRETQSRAQVSVGKSFKTLQVCEYDL